MKHRIEDEEFEKLLRELLATLRQRQRGELVIACEHFVEVLTSPKSAVIRPLTVEHTTD